jgi:hypothetical protein
MIRSRELVAFLAALAVDPRETAGTKALRLLASGRLSVTGVGTNTIDATCRGDSAQVHACGFDAGRWYCSCPGTGDRCSHLIALRLVVVRPGETR